MAGLDPDIDAAVAAQLERATPDQTGEFKRRLRRLIENALLANETDSDVRDVIELALVDDKPEE